MESKMCKQTTWEVGGGKMESKMCKQNHMGSRRRHAQSGDGMMGGGRCLHAIRMKG